MVDFTATHPDILLLVGSQTGNSEAVAEVVAERLGQLGFVCHVVDMAEAYPEMLADYRQLVVVMCTWAEGTFPDNAVDFYDALVAIKTDFSGLSYGMIGLGDHDYDPFYLTANYQLAGMLEKRGAIPVIEVLDIDGTPKPHHMDQARTWVMRAAKAFSTER